MALPMNAHALHCTVPRFAQRCDTHVLTIQEGYPGGGGEGEVIVQQRGQVKLLRKNFNFESNFL